MLKAFRQQGLTSAVYGVLIVATVVVFVVQFRPGAQGRTGSIKQECAAEVRGRCIEPKEYQAELMLTAPGRIFEASVLKAYGVRRAVLDGLVERTLLVQDADRLGITISEEDLDNELVAGRAHVSLPVESARMYGNWLGLGVDLVRRLPVTNPETKAFDYKIYDRKVREFSNRSPTEFKAMQKEELVAARMRDLVRSRVRIGEEEAFATYQREKATVTVRFATFRRAWFARHVLDTSPAAVDAWAKTHKEEIDRVFDTRKSQYLPECRAARLLFVKVPPGAGDDQKGEARTKIEGALDRAKKGEDFGKIARHDSDDPSAAEGGMIGCFQRGAKPKPVEDAAFALGAKEISNVVETTTGFYVVKIDAIYRDADAETFGRQDTAKELMQTHEGEAMAAETAKKVLTAVKSGAKFDAAVAEALPAAPKSKAGKDKNDKGKDAPATDAGDVSDIDRPRVEVSAPFNSNGDPIQGVSSGQSVAQIAFKLEKDGAVPDDLVKLDDGYAVIQLKEKNPASKQQFESERDAFIAAMLAAKQSDALNGYVARLKESAKTETKLNEAYYKAPAQEKQSEGEEE
jgi:peptidyl-prolyl cis-trans isomerase D